MSIILRKCVVDNIAGRSFSSTSILENIKWRIAKGLSVNPNAEGILTDGPDYTFLDGRPTPLLHKQKVRMLQQKQYAQQIVRMCAELDFAKERFKQLKTSEQERRQRILDDRLKAKGIAMKKK